MQQNISIKKQETITSEVEWTEFYDDLQFAVDSVWGFCKFPISVKNFLQKISGAQRTAQRYAPVFLPQLQYEVPRTLALSRRVEGMKGWLSMS